MTHGVVRPTQWSVFGGWHPQIGYELTFDKRTTTFDEAIETYQARLDAEADRREARRLRVRNVMEASKVRALRNGIMTGLQYHRWLMTWQQDEREFSLTRRNDMMRRENPETAAELEMHFLQAYLKELTVMHERQVHLMHERGEKRVDIDLEIACYRCDVYFLSRGFPKTDWPNWWSPRVFPWRAAALLEARTKLPFATDPPSVVQLSRSILLHDLAHSRARSSSPNSSGSPDGSSRSSLSIPRAPLLKHILSTHDDLHRAEYRHTSSAVLGWMAETKDFPPFNEKVILRTSGSCWTRFMNIARDIFQAMSAFEDCACKTKPMCEKVAPLRHMGIVISDLLNGCFDKGLWDKGFSLWIHDVSSRTGEPIYLFDFEGLRYMNVWCPGFIRFGSLCGYHKATRACHEHGC